MSNALLSPLLKELKITRIKAITYLQKKDIKVSNDINVLISQNVEEILRYEFQNKPQSIIALEQKLNINIYRVNIDEVESSHRLTTFDRKTNFYSINENNEIIGLDLESCKIKDISFIANFDKLQYLNLERNVITNVDYLKNLLDLEVLYLDFNIIKVIFGLSNLSNLRRLGLSNNKISDINPLSSLKSLTYLNLHDNFVDTIDPLADLKALVHLDVSSNEISNIDIIKNFDLWQYDFSYNLITEIPIEFFNRKHFHNNDQFLLLVRSFKNQIVKFQKYELASTLRSLEKRTEFLINQQQQNIEEDSVNRFKIVEDELTYLNFLSKFKGNSIQTPPAEIVEEGIDAIFRHFERVDTQEKDFIFEAKVTLVGEGSAGKTSLQVRLINKNATLPKKENRTRGIDVVEYNFENYKAHIWDFGGQDVYYPVHRFFLTNDSVYILVASTRTNVHNFDYWIPTIYQFGGESPIVIIQNCFDNNTANWNNDLSVFYSNPEYNVIKPYLSMNLPNKNEGLEIITSVIQNSIKTLPLIGKEVVKSWVLVREEIFKVSNEKSCISFNEFKNLCRKVDEINFKNDVEIIDLGKFLHKLGVILWFDDKEILKNFVVLKPEWLMNAVYLIIDDKESDKGYISAVDFQRIWSEPHYNEKQIFLKNILEKFKIAFPKQKSSDYILPARARTLPDSLVWKLSELERFIRIEYNFDFMPYGLVNQVSADLSKYVANDDSVWFNAVNIKKSKSEAQIEEDRYYRKLHIKARGSDARDLIAIVMKSIDDVIEEYRGVVPKIVVPCNCMTCIESLSPELFEYTKIINWIDNGEDSKYCNNSNSVINLRSLIHESGFDYVSKTEYDKIITENKTMKNKSDSNGNQIFNISNINTNTNTNVNKIDVSELSSYNEIKELLLDLKEAGEDNKLWQDTLVKCLDEFNRFEVAEDKSAQKTSISIIGRLFKKLKDIKDVAAIGFLTVDIQKKWPDLMSQWDAFKSLFN